MVTKKPVKNLNEKTKISKKIAFVNKLPRKRKVLSDKDFKTKRLLIDSLDRSYRQDIELSKIKWNTRVHNSSISMLVSGLFSVLFIWMGLYFSSIILFVFFCYHMYRGVSCIKSSSIESEKLLSNYVDSLSIIVRMFEK
jgi:hypothetical protein